MARMLTILNNKTWSCFSVTDWSQIAATIYSGEGGQAFRRTLNVGDLRVRMVEYKPGYLADHWCDRGHVLCVLEGAHRSSTKAGAKLFIVD
jgi:hypothetical protein